MLRILHLTRPASLAMFATIPLKGKAFWLCESLLHSKSQRRPPLASNIGLLVLVHPPVGRVVMILLF